MPATTAAHSRLITGKRERSARAAASSGARGGRVDGSSAGTSGTRFVTRTTALRASFRGRATFRRLWS